MNNSKCLYCAYLIDADGNCQKLSWTEIETWSPDQGLLWLHLNCGHRKTGQWLSNHSGLKKLAVEGLLAHETRPKAQRYGQGLLAVLRGINFNDDQEPEDMVAIRVWCDKNRVITTAKRNLRSIAEIERELSEGNIPESSGKFLLMLTEKLHAHIAQTVYQIEDEVELLEESFENTSSAKARGQIADLRRTIIQLRRHLSPQREALQALANMEDSVLSNAERAQFREATDNVMRYLEVLNSARERAVVTQEEISNQIAEQMNSRMYMLSIVALIFLPLSFLTGLLGVNVGGIPGATYPYALALLCAMLVLITFAVIYYLYRKSWL